MKINSLGLKPLSIDLSCLSTDNIKKIDSVLADEYRLFTSMENMYRNEENEEQVQWCMRHKEHIEKELDKIRNYIQ